MLIKGIGVNPAGMLPAAGQNIPENVNQAQPEENIFGPEYEVTISEEGKALSELQAAQPGAGGQAVQNSKMMEVMSRQLEEAQLDAKTRKGYWDELDGLETQIKVLNAAYGRMKENLSYNDPAMKEVVEQQRLLKQEMQEQKDFQAEEGLKRLEEALKIAAMQSAQYKGEIDENNRDLVALLRTMEEAEKAEEERENGSSQDDRDGVSDTDGSAGSAIKDSASGFLKSSINREKGVQELTDTIDDSGRSYLMQADSIAKGLLKKNRFLKEAVYDESFTRDQLGEMMADYRSEVSAKSYEALILGSFGTQVILDMRDAKIQHIADDPSKSMRQTQDGMIQAAADAALGEARKSSLDKESKRLAEEVERLIDERNHVDRTHEEKPEEEETQEKVLQAEEQKEE